MTPLRQLTIEEMQIRNLAPNTQDAYILQISLFARYFGKSPELLGPSDIRAYQLHLIHDRHLSASSILVATSALRFLYNVVLKRGWDLNEPIVSARPGTCSEWRVNRRKLALLEPSSVAPEGGSRVRCGDPRPGRAAAEMEY
jgi:Phage integrase, N-terminal SAM-like domain